MMMKKNVLLVILLFTVIVSLLVTVLYGFGKRDSYITGIENIIISECGGREVTKEEYNSLNGKNVMFYPFDAVLQKSEYYNNDKCALYIKYKNNELDKYSSDLNAELNSVLYYQESYLPGEESIIRGLFQIEVRDYKEETDCINMFNEEYTKLDNYYKKLKEDGYISDFGSYEKWSSGLVKQSNYLVICECQQNSNNLWGEILTKNESSYTHIKYSFEDCDQYYNDLCMILDYMSIPHPKDIEME